MVVNTVSTLEHLVNSWDTSAVNNSNKNLGEEGEVFLKAFLVQQMSLGNEIKFFGKINSLDFGPGFTVPEWKTEYSQMLNSMDYQGLKKIFPKAPGTYKADIGINGKNYSVKYKGGARSAIVNHTNRKGFLRVCEEVGVGMDQLDSIIREYWEKREAGVITEDVSNSNLQSPFRNHKEYLENFLRYFLFEGTGGRDSKFKADAFIEFSNPKDPETYNILSKEDVINHVWDSLVFSVRSKKGMPLKYNPELNADLSAWVRYRPGDEYPKGALHIRS